MQRHFRAERDRLETSLASAKAKASTLRVPAPEAGTLASLPLTFGNMSHVAFAASEMVDFIR